MPTQRLRCAMRNSPACVTYQWPSRSWRSPGATDTAYSSLKFLSLEIAVLERSPHLVRARRTFNLEILVRFFKGHNSQDTTPCMVLYVLYTHYVKDFS